jgi:hypothetical protein
LSKLGKGNVTRGHTHEYEFPIAFSLSAKDRLWQQRRDHRVRDVDGIAHAQVYCDAANDTGLIAGEAACASRKRSLPAGRISRPPQGRQYQAIRIDGHMGRRREFVLSVKRVQDKRQKLRDFALPVR